MLGIVSGIATHTGFLGVPETTFLIPKHANMDFMMKPTWEREPSICQSPDRRGNSNKEVIALILPQLVILLTASSPLILILRFPSLLQELLLLRITSSA